MLVTWSRCEWLTKMWSIFASASSERSPTPVPASTSTSSSTSSEVVRRLPPMPPLHPKTRMCISTAWTLALSCKPAGAVAVLTGDPIIDPLSENVTTANVRHSTEWGPGILQPPDGEGTGRPAARRPGSWLVEELHLDARDLDQVVVPERVRLGAQGGAVQRGIGRALDVGD